MNLEPSDALGAVRRPTVTVLHILDKLSVDGSQIHGPGRQVSYRVPYYDPSRYTVIICTLRGEDPASREMRAKGLEVISCARGTCDLRVLPDLCRLIRDRRPGLLHLSGYAAWTFGRLAGALMRVPVVIQEHFVDQRVPWYQRATDWGLQRFQRQAIAVSDSVRSFMIRDRYIRRTPIQVIGNGVPLDQVRRPDAAEREALRRSLGLAPGTRVVGIVGRLAEMKGHTYFLRAAKTVSQTVSRLVFVIVGEGPLREALQREAEALGIADRVIFAGYQPDVVRYLSIFDVSVISSIFGEGFCSVGIESFMAGTPVVMTEIACVEGTYEHRQNVLRVPTRDADALAAAIIEILTHPALAKALVHHAQGTLRSCTIAQTAARYLRCYERALEGAHGSAAYADEVRHA